MAGNDSRACPQVFCHLRSVRLVWAAQNPEQHRAKGAPTVGSSDTNVNNAAHEAWLIVNEHLQCGAFLRPGLLRLFTQTLPTASRHQSASAQETGTTGRDTGKLEGSLGVEDR